MPCKQLVLITKDKVKLSTYVARVFDGVAQNSHLRKDNYFYFNCCTGRFARDCCPAYLEKANFERLKAGLIDGLQITSGTFNAELLARKYNKVGDKSEFGLKHMRSSPARWVVCCLRSG